MLYAINKWGSSIIIRPDIKYRILDLNRKCSDCSIEIFGVILIEINTLVLSQYRSPSGKSDEFYAQLDNCLSLFGNKHYIALWTDLNIDFNQPNKLVNWLKIRLNLNIYTHHHCRQHVVRHVLTTLWLNFPRNLYDPRVIYLPYSDHDDLLLTVPNINKGLTKQYIYYCYTDRRTETYKEISRCLKWDILSTQDSEVAF